MDRRVGARVCEFYQQGRCRFGNKCKYLHNKSLYNKYYDPTKKINICEDYKLGRCKFSDKECEYPHIDCERFYETGKCKFGDRCKLAHVKREYCFYHSFGHCHYGDRCLLSHSKPSDLPFDFHCFTYISRVNVKFSGITYRTPHYDFFYTKDGLQFYYYQSNGKKIVYNRYLMYQIFDRNKELKDSMIYNNCVKVVQDYIKDYNVYRYLIENLYEDLVEIVFNVYLNVTQSESRNYYFDCLEFNEEDNPKSDISFNTRF